MVFVRGMAKAQAIQWFTPRREDWELIPRLSWGLCPKRIACAAGLVILTTAVAAACGPSDPEEVEIEVSLQDKQLVPQTIRVSQDDTVTLKIDSDAPGSLHLHGYDIEQTVTPGTVADFVFRSTR